MKVGIPIYLVYGNTKGSTGIYEMEANIDHFAPNTNVHECVDCRTAMMGVLWTTVLTYIWTRLGKVFFMYIQNFR